MNAIDQFEYANQRLGYQEGLVVAMGVQEQLEMAQAEIARLREELRISAEQNKAKN